jgi:hypothetical protein
MDAPASQQTRANLRHPIPGWGMPIGPNFCSAKTGTDIWATAFSQVKAYLTRQPIWNITAGGGPFLY